MKLNRTPNPLNRDARNKENENWDTIQQKFNNVVEEVSDAAFQKVIDGSKIDWEQMVDKVSDLPSNVETGETRGVKEDNKIYRFNGTDWIPIAEINLNPIAEVDQRLTTQLAQTDEQVYKNAMFPLGIQTYDGGNQTTHPDVIYFPNRWNGFNFWMVHTPYPNSDNTKENPSIACSQDGISWAVPEGLVNPIDKPTEDEFAAGGFYSDAVLVMRGSTMECWYRFMIPSQNIERIYRKTSTNGRDWSEKETTMTVGVDTQTAQILSPTVIYEGGKYKVWFVSHETPERNGSRKLFYTESSDGKTNWSTPVIVPISWEEGERNLAPWHIDVTKEGNRYNLIVNTASHGSGRKLAWATSDDGLSFENCKVILDTPRVGWDNGNLYRASLAHFGSSYILYYGARNKDSFWQVGALAGEDIDRLKPLVPYDYHGNAIINKLLSNEIRAQDEVRVGSERDRAYFAKDELQFNTRGEKNVKLANTEDNTLELISLSDRDDLGVFKSNEIQAHSYVQIGNEESEGRTGLTHPDGHGAGFKVWTIEPDTLELIRRNGASGGSLRLAQLILSGSIPAMEVEGAIRYSRGQKKLQIYNGERWETVESS